MDYIRNSENGQLVFTQSIEFLRIPSCLYGFMNHTTTTEMTASGRTAFCFHGELDASEDDIIYLITFISLRTSMTRLSVKYARMNSVV
ncbi:TPA: hypothetical protein ACGOZH_001795, partial [Streptococcus suis]